MTNEGRLPQTSHLQCHVWPAWGKTLTKWLMLTYSSKINLRTPSCSVLINVVQTTNFTLSFDIWTQFLKWLKRNTWFKDQKAYLINWVTCILWWWIMTIRLTFSWIKSLLNLEGKSLHMILSDNVETQYKYMHIQIYTYIYHKP